MSLQEKLPVIVKWLPTTWQKKYLKIKPRRTQGPQAPFVREESKSAACALLPAPTPKVSEKPAGEGCLGFLDGV